MACIFKYATSECGLFSSVRIGEFVTFYNKERKILLAWIYLIVVRHNGDAFTHSRVKYFWYKPNHTE